MKRTLGVWLRLWLRVWMLAPLMAAQAASQADTRPALPIEAWQLHSTRGRSLNERSLDGRWLMVYLGSARCGERCEPPLRLMQGVMDRLGFFESRQVAALFLAVEPARDTLQGVAELLRPLAPRVEGLVGRSFDINTAARALGVASGDVCRSDITLTEQRSQEALHARRFYIVMPDRRIAASIDEAEPHDAVVRHLRLLIANNR